MSLQMGGKALRIEFSAGAGVASDRQDVVVALAVQEGRSGCPELETVDASFGDALRRTLNVSRFSGELDEVFGVALGGAYSPYLLLIGAGPSGPMEDLRIERVAGAAYKAAATSGTSTLEIHFNELSAAQAARAAFGATLAAYRFDKYRTQEPAKKKSLIEAVRVITPNPAAADEAFRVWAPLAEAVALARDLASEPPNVLYPAEFARRAKELERFGLKVEVHGQRELEALGMRALLGVGQGSARESQLVVIRWDGAATEQRPIVFVGKGVCFDSGGISLKQPKGMELMKWDMAGAAAVTGAMYALARRSAPVNAVGALALVENMPDGNAQRPGDIVRSMSGQTVEIINTDAEGRLILADALWYCQDRFQPRAMVDVATLTGMVQTALGKEYAGLFCNDDALANQLIQASNEEGEPLWRFPLTPQHEKQIESLAADMKNADDSNVGGGAITAAIFLKRFVNGRSWAHLDISGAAWREPSNVSTSPDGATGYGVRLLSRLTSNFEQRR